MQWSIYFLFHAKGSLPSL